MFLKTLQVQGFKSFPDKTVINFNQGITAIVGPNGSGKSNIADAVRWVLGEMSTKTLRGTKMEDVIFDGSDSRSPMGFSEVAITLDNTDKNLPVDFAEVTVSRRYYRSGESEYMINKNPVRLKDINELFMNTGLGRDGYSIIGQGRIADILSAKSEDRRQIFEEAAGISKYRYRKAESERRLQQTDENLVRVGDILKELSERVGPLAQQAETAREYIDLREEQKGLEVSLWLDSIDGMQAGRDKLESDFAAAQSHLDKVSGALDADNARIEELGTQIQEITSAIESSRSETASLISQRQEREAETGLRKSDLEHNIQRIERLASELDADSGKINEFDGVIAARGGEIAAMNAEIAEKNAALTRLLDRSAALNEKTVGAAGKLDLLNSQVSELTRRLTEAQIKIGYSENNCTVLSENFERIAAQLSAATSEKQALGAEDAHLRAELAQNEAETAELNKTLDEYKLRIETMQIRIEKQAKIKSELDNNINEKNIRLSTLRDMQSHFDGFNESVRNVMKAHESGKLSGVHGPVSTIIRMQDQYAVAIETALGNQIQNVIVGTEQNAKDAVYYLKSTGGGRATFLPVSTIRGRTISSEGMTGSLGFVGIASELVKCDDKFREIINWLLGRVCVVYNLENAMMLAKQIGYKYRIVTLDGQVINAGGSYTGGSAAKGSGLLVRQNEIKRLGVELEKHMKDLAAANIALDDLVGQHCKDSDYAEELRNRIKIQNDGKTALTIRLEDVSQRIIKASEQLKSLTDMNERSNNEFLAARQLQSDENDLVKNIGSQLNCLNKEIAELSGGAGELAQQRDALEEEISSLRVELITRGKDLEAASMTLAQLQSFRSERSEAAQAREKEIESLRFADAVFEQQIVEYEKNVAEIGVKLAEVAAGIEKSVALREQAERSVTELRAGAGGRQADKERMIREVERLNIRRENVSVEYDTLIARLFDEYELTLTAAQPLRIKIENKEKSARRLTEIKNKIKRMGDVYVGAIEEYKAVRQRYDFMTEQTNDLLAAKEDIQKVIADLTVQMKSIFGEQFVVINGEFGKTFSELFGGGRAELVLSDPDDLLNSGIEIRVTPPGKVIKNLSALSGGEQAFVAIALYFAIMRVRPTPFCIMDEIETSLDEVNTVKFADFLGTITDKTQIIAITHRRSTMEKAGILYGVTMQEKGVSKLLTINVGEVYDQMQIE